MPASASAQREPVPLWIRALAQSIASSGKFIIAPFTGWRNSKGPTRLAYSGLLAYAAALYSARATAVTARRATVVKKPAAVLQAPAKQINKFLRIEALGRAYAMRLSREFTGLDDAQGLVNAEVNALVKKYSRKPEYRRASKIINEEWIHGIMLGESGYWPWLMRFERAQGNKLVPATDAHGETTDNGLGQITEDGLEQAIRDGALDDIAAKEKLRKLKASHLRILPPPREFERSIREFERQQGADASAIRELYDRELTEFAGKKGKAPEKLTDGDFREENGWRIKLNLRALVHSAYNNAERPLRHHARMKVPPLTSEEVAALSYKDGAKGTIEQLENPARLSDLDEYYVGSRRRRTARVAQAIGTETERRKKTRTPSFKTVVRAERHEKRGGSQLPFVGIAAPWVLGPKSRRSPRRR